MPLSTDQLVQFALWAMLFIFLLLIVALVLHVLNVLDERATRRREQELAPRFNDIELLKHRLDVAEHGVAGFQAGLAFGMQNVTITIRPSTKQKELTSG